MRENELFKEQVKTEFEASPLFSSSQGFGLSFLRLEHEIVVFRNTSLHDTAHLFR